MGKILCNVVGDGDYEMDGQLLILKVQGKGKIHVVLSKLSLIIYSLKSRGAKQEQSTFGSALFSLTKQKKDDESLRNIFARSHLK